MAVSTTENKKIYSCDGVATTFSFPYKVFSDNDLIVVLTDSVGLETELVKTTGYTVAAISGDYANGATVTTVSTYALGCSITILRSLSLTQETIFPASGAFPSSAVNNAIDKLTMLCQQLKEKIGRVVKVPVSDLNEVSNLPTAEARAGKVLAFDAEGNFVASDSVSSVPVTGFMATVLDDTSAASARATLDVPNNAETQAMADAAEANADSTSAASDSVLQSQIDSEKVKTRNRDMVLAMEVSVNTGMSAFQMTDGVTDMYEDEQGVDAANSTNESYVDDNGDVKLLLHCDGSQGRSATGLDGTGNRTVSDPPGATVYNDTQRKFGIACVGFDGISDYLTISDSDDWNICENLTDDWTIDLYVKHTDHAGTEYYFAQYVDANNKMYLFHSDGNGLIFASKVAGAGKVSTGYGGEITDTNWHHIAVVKVGAAIGLYKDGVRVGSDTAVAGDLATYASDLFIGQNGAGADFFNGYMDEIRITKSNIFGADPATAGDTITVPTAAMVLKNEKYYKPTTGNNMVLISEPVAADTQPADGYITFLIDEVESLIINTDVTAEITCDGATWDLVTLTSQDLGSGMKRLTGSVTLTGTGTAMQYRIKNLNNKDVHVQGVSLLWD